MTASSTFRTDVQLVQMPAKQARGRVSSTVLGLAHRKCARLGNARGVPSLWRAGATSIAGKDFCLQTRQRARCRAGPRAFYKLRDGIVPLICPTCQNVFAGFAQGIDASDHHATLHGVVFDILVGSESRALRGQPRRASYDNFDFPVFEPIDSSNYAEFPLFDRCVENRRRGLELCNIVDHILPNGGVEGIAGTLRSSVDCG